MQLPSHPAHFSHFGINFGDVHHESHVSRQFQVADLHDTAPGIDRDMPVIREHRVGLSQRLDQVVVQGNDRSGHHLIEIVKYSVRIGVDHSEPVLNILGVH